MQLSEERAINSVDALIDATKHLEHQLDLAGEVHAHEWMFAIREVLYDIRRLNLQLLDICTKSDATSVSSHLQYFAESVLYEALPHIKGHMESLEQSVADGLARPNNTGTVEDAEDD